MKKNALLLCVVFVFAVAMLAQDTHGGSGSSQYPSGSSQSGSSMGGQSGTSGSQSGTSDMTGSQGSTSGQASSNQPGVSTVEGCIYREATDYYIYPTRGSQMKVGGQDVSSHLGHHVKLHGAKQSGTTSTASTTGGTGAAAGETTSAGASENKGTGTMAGSSATGSSPTASATSGNQFIVERVDMVSESCPDKIRKKIESSGGNLGTGSSGSSSGGTSTNPPK